MNKNKTNLDRLKKQTFDRLSGWSSISYSGVITNIIHKYCVRNSSVGNNIGNAFNLVFGIWDATHLTSYYHNIYLRMFFFIIYKMQNTNYVK